MQPTGVIEQFSPPPLRTPPKNPNQISTNDRNNLSKISGALRVEIEIKKTRNFNTHVLNEIFAISIFEICLKIIILFKR